MTKKFTYIWANSQGDLFYSGGEDAEYISTVRFDDKDAEHADAVKFVKAAKVGWTHQFQYAIVVCTEASNA